MKEDPDGTDAQREVFKSSKGDISWSSSPYNTQCRAPTENIIKMTPGPTRYAVLHSQDNVWAVQTTISWEDPASDNQHGREKGFLAIPGQRSTKHSWMQTWGCCFLLGCTNPLIWLLPAYKMVSQAALFFMLLCHFRPFMCCQEWSILTVGRQESLGMWMTNLLPLGVFWQMGGAIAIHVQSRARGYRGWMALKATVASGSIYQAPQKNMENKSWMEYWKTVQEVAFSRGVWEVSGKSPHWKMAVAGQNPSLCQFGEHAFQYSVYGFILKVGFMKNLFCLVRNIILQGSNLAHYGSPFLPLLN